jgi:uncharacterized membrane protein
MWWNIHPGVRWWGIIGLAVWGINKLTRTGGKGETPMEIAQRRYARGEISRKEFEIIKSTLESGADPATGTPHG